MRWKAAAALLIGIATAQGLRAECWAVLENGNKYKIPDSECKGDSSGQGNSPGTASFEMANDRRLTGVSVCYGKLVDGTSVAMRGLPRITGGQLTYTDELGRLVALPLREVTALDSGKRYPCTSCARDAQGKLVGRPEPQAAFIASHPCPAAGSAAGTCTGYVVDHVTPLACGGQDTPENMQWATDAHAKIKQQWAQRACAG
jgi:hypothetical protein